MQTTPLNDFREYKDCLIDWDCAPIRWSFRHPHLVLYSSKFNFQLISAFLNPASRPLLCIHSTELHPPTNRRRRPQPPNRTILETYPTPEPLSVHNNNNQIIIHHLLLSVPAELMRCDDMVIPRSTMNWPFLAIVCLIVRSFVFISISI